jgi:ATP-binding cassette subfamily F protein uup
VASYLENFLFSSDEIKRPIHTFSGGEKNRLQLAQFMKHARDLWIFDEPTNDLDLETIGILEEELRNYEGALIIVGHDRSFIDNVTDKCWVLHEGKLENFEAGFSQAELFLEAIHLEEELKKKNPPVEIKKEANKDRLSNKERNRYNEIQGEIEKQETKAAALKTEMAGSGFSKLAELQAKLDVVEAKIESLLNEWAELEAKL